MEELAERTGALLATTLPARGIFDHNPFSIGIAGIAREIGAQADLVVVIGATLSTAVTCDHTGHACSSSALRSS